MSDTGATRFLRRWRFVLLTALLCGWMLLSPHTQQRWIMQVLLQLFLINFVAVTLWANPRWGAMRQVLIWLWVVALAGTAATLVPGLGVSPRLAQTAEGASLLPLLLLLAIGVLRHVFRHRQLDADGIFATIAVYLLIAFVFAQLYVMIALWVPDSFNLAVAERTTQQLHADLLYFSMITLATVGYGDVLPLSETARSLAVIEATTGQFYVAIIVAVFVGMYSSQRRD